MKPTLQNVARAPAFLALVAGVAFAVGGPPFPAPILFIAYVGAVAFAFILERATLWRAAVRGFFFGFGMNLVVLSFVPATIVRFTDIPSYAAFGLFVLLAAGQSVAWAIAGFVVGALRRFAVPLVVAFPVGVWGATWSPTLFAWTMATPLARAPILLQLAEMIGERGVAIGLAVACAAIASSLRAETERRRRLLVAALAIVVGLFLYGAIRAPAVSARRGRAPTIPIALVQQAIPPKERWRPEAAPEITHILWSLTRAAQRDGAQIVVWPEAAFPYEIGPDEPRDDGAIPIRGVGVQVDVLTGVLARVPNDGSTARDAIDHYNAATIVRRDGTIAPVAAKLELLPFGESVPFGEELPILRRIFARGGGLRPGKDVVLLESDTAPIVRAGVVNCYEDTLPSVARRVARAGPNLLVNVTNDAWFGETAEPELHLLAATARAIESRRDMIRAVNTGVTAHVDSLGRIVASAPQNTRTFLVVHPALLDDPPTIYVRFGDATWSVPLSLALVAALACRGRRKAARGTSPRIPSPSKATAA